MNNKEKICYLLDKLVYTLEDIGEIWEDDDEIGDILTEQYPYLSESVSFYELYNEMNFWRSAILDKLNK